MKYRTNLSLLIIILLIYILNQVFLKNINISFFNNYLNDLLAVPLFFSIVNIIAKYDMGKTIVEFKYLLLITIVLSFLGEYIALFTRKGSVIDYLDIICYFIGMLFYYTIVKLEN